MIAHIAFHLIEQLLTHAVQWLDAAFLVEFHKVPAEACWEWFAHFAWLHIKGDVLEWLNHHTSAKPTEVASTYCGAFVIGMCGSYLCKVSTCQYYLIQAVNMFFCINGHTFAATRHHFHDVCCMHFLEGTFFLYQCDVQSVWAAEHFGHFANGGVIYGLLEWIDKAEYLNPTQFSAVLFACRVIGHLACYVSKGFWLAHGHPFATLFHFLFYACCHAFACQLNFSFSSCHSSRIGIGWALNSYVCCAAHVGLTVVAELHQAVNSLVILHVFRCRLRAIACQLFLKGLGGVHALCDSFCHFEFEVNE